MLHRRKLARQSGFSLVETAIAAVFLAIGLLALAQLLLVAMNQNAMSRSTSVAISIAQGKLEELRTEYNQGLESGVSPSSLSSGPHSAETASLPGGYGTGMKTYLVSWTVADVIGAEKTVEVTVRSEKGINFLNTRSVTITSHFAP